MCVHVCPCVCSCVGLCVRHADEQIPWGELIYVCVCARVCFVVSKIKTGPKIMSAGGDSEVDIWHLLWHHRQQRHGLGTEILPATGSRGSQHAAFEFVRFMTVLLLCLGGARWCVKSVMQELVNQTPPKILIVVSVTLSEMLKWRWELH